MITAFRRCREYNSAPSCLIVSGTQKQKIILRSRDNSSVLKRRSRYWRHSGLGWINSVHIREQQRPNKGTRLAKAVNYAQNRKDTLMTYLEDGHCSLSNNLSENAIRPFSVGRKNWLFSASPKGAASSAIVYTMVEMAKANDLNTYKYLTYLLSQRPDAKMSDEQLEQLAPEQLEQLAPWSETAKANCQN